MFKKLLFLGILLMLIPSALAYTNTTVNFNSSEINILKQVNITLPLNHTGLKNITIKRLDTNSRFIINSTSNFTTSLNTTKLRFWLKTTTKYTTNFTETYLFNITKSYKTVQNISNVTTNVTNIQSYLLGINARYTYIPSPITPFVYVVIGGNTTVNLSSTLSNRKDTLSYTIYGEFGYSINVSCDSWLSCNPTTSFDMYNRTKYAFTYTVPLSTKAGKYLKQISFKYGNKTISRTIIFNVNDPDISMLVYNPPEQCLVQAKKPNSQQYESAVLSECLEEYQAFYVAQLKKYLEAYYPQNITPVKEYVDHYIMYGNISKVTMDELQTCRKDRADMVVRMIDLNDVNLILTKNVSTCQGGRLMEYKDYQANLNRTTSYLISLKNYEVKKTKDTYQFWMIVLVGGLLLVEGIIFWIIKNQEELIETPDAEF